VSSRRTVIFANGSLAHPDEARKLLEPDDRIICADGGTRYALSLGITPDLVLGDLDSLTEADQRRLIDGAVVVRRHPRDKDETDLELALDQALRDGTSAILIIAALGKRLDQVLGNISLMSDPRLSNANCRMDDGLEEVLFCRSACTIHGTRGDIVSLIPWGNSVKGVRTDGLRWALSGDTLHVHKSRGISNEMLSTSASVQVENGVLLVIHRRRLQQAAEEDKKEE
jgi:thiamine pyrophosphokinase